MTRRQEIWIVEFRGSVNHEFVERVIQEELGKSVCFSIEAVNGESLPTPPFGKRHSPTNCGCPVDPDGVQTHPRDCQSVAWLDEVAQEMAPELSEMARARQRAAGEAANIVLG